MKLTVQTLTGKSHTLDVDDTISVATLKTQIQGHIGASASEQALFCNGHELQDDTPVGEVSSASLRLLMRMRGGVMMEPSLQVLARKYNCDKLVCRKCYARLPPRAHNCRSKTCGHTSELRPKKKLK
mmetsp:Transcript_81482/g.136366  ORF Transcript_81482/g.136366 Transcript_81482/m.136366 type:complete len:127 (+) Transcript_81482:62-442(+)|eukprot:CAMPEP_0174285416 /NCGR_PEP_ID=MMETSP0809-20121228/8692_1 /TAXON_ID=73025 ORGANISM="Eutreptiella gymnastica-like, Strain CCMP1594" /NCGR_SAMPLE_ID=MMETSP0809 /ASSEMBLY_ACC=CAM_ASM_000658 /LENGTH=126 /DNA_ID=CAMNT_0015381199 /DNA_START=41 /DNA_END=421 /DNA_ORIENTATION=-